MLNRIGVDIIYMFLKIIIVANKVFPKPALPNASFPGASSDWFSATFG